MNFNKTYHYIFALLMMSTSLTNQASENCSDMLNLLSSENEKFSMFILDIKNDAKSLKSLFSRDWRIDLSKIPHMSSSEVRRNLAEQRKWAKQILAEKGALPVNDHSIDLTEEPVLYNWGREMQNIRNVQVGISNSDLKSLLTQKNPAHLGIYAASDPVSSALFGDVLVKIRLYRPLSSYQLSDDPTSRSGGPMNLPLPFFKTGSYSIRDIRGVKKFSFPNRSLILQSWFAEDNDFTLEAYRKFSSQWLLTPNYSAQERHLVFRSDRERFFNYLDHVTYDFDLFPVYEAKPKRFNINELKLNSVFETLLNSSQMFVAYDGVINYKAALEAIKKLDNADLDSLKKFIDRSEKSRFQMVLDYTIAMSEGRISKINDAKTELINYLAYVHNDSKSYKFYKKEIIDSELNSINSLN
ncbi:hypothetical protein OAQ84_01910 [Bdellovibrionales bacterium]|nr:hypothetical protein [Bdellovibrionales bacterium]